MSTPGTMPPSDTAPPAKKSNRWIWIVLGLVGCFGLGMIAVLLGGAMLFLGRVKTAMAEAQVTSAVIQIQSFQSALDLYEADCGSYPTAAQGLDALVHNPGSCPRWKPYLTDSAVPLDPWGHAYEYTSPGTHGQAVEISSPGPDGKLGTSDDVNSWGSGSASAPEQSL